MMRLWFKQVLAVMRLEMKKTFFTNRGLWIYVLALAPALLCMTHSIYAGKERKAMAEVGNETAGLQPRPQCHPEGY